MILLARARALAPSARALALASVVSRAQESSACTVASVTWADFDGFEFRYVDNANAAVGGYSVGDFDAYVEEVHATWIGPTSETGGSWFNWDHWLDTHIGLKYQPVDPSCLTADAALRSVLQSNGVPTAERKSLSHDQLTTHYYTGYKGSLAWEYNVQCSSVDDSAPDVCACIASNNDLIFAEDAGGASCRDPDAAHLRVGGAANATDDATASSGDDAAPPPAFGTGDRPYA